MADYKWLTLTETADGVLTLTLDRPPVNALGVELADELQRAIAQLAGNERARVLILRSEGKHFCAGADLAERKQMTVEDVRRFVPRLAAITSGLAALAYPTIAAVRGAALGGGCELALACDMRLLAEDASLGLRETALAIIPGAGGTQRLTRLIGMGRAKRWILAASVHTAAEALADGVADEVVPLERLDAAAQALAQTIAANGPVAVRQAKRVIEQGADQPLEEALRLEWTAYETLLDTEDRLEGLRAFSEKRPPEYKGR
jgi:methylglutaconyl-CoA hydratase